MGRVLWSALISCFAGLVGFMLLFGNPLSQRLIYSDDYGQSRKLLDVWQSLPPIPPLSPAWDRLTRVDLAAVPVILLLYLWSVGLVWIYSLVSPSIPGEGWRKGLRFGVGIWAVGFLFFEIFTPLNLFGEPLYLIAYELVLEMGIALVIGATIAATIGSARKRET